MNKCSEDKIKNIILYILLHFDGGIDYIKFCNIVYAIYKRYLAMTGKHIIEDDFVATKDGPIPVFVSEYIRTKFKDDMSINNNIVCAKRRPNMDYVTIEEEQTIDFVIDSYWNDEPGFINKYKDLAYSDALCNKDKRFSITEI